MRIIEQTNRRLDELDRDGMELPRAAPARQRGFAVLDLDRLAASGHVVPSQPRTLVAEEFRYIKRPLLRNARSADAAASRSGLIAVTSAVSGEGKTFSAINLAMSLSMEIDTSVLLVDADVLRPDLLGRLGVAPRPGLLDLLADPGLVLDDVVLDTNVPKLSLLPAGTCTGVATEWMASEAMGSLLVDLARAAPRRLVVFDAPPLLMTNEAKVLASRVGQVVLVVEASRTPRSVVAAAFNELQKCPAVMSLLNKAPDRSAHLGYGYGYGEN